VLLTYRSRLRGRFEGKGAVGGMNRFPVDGSPETHPPSWAQTVFAYGQRLSMGRIRRIYAGS